MSNFIVNENFLKKNSEDFKKYLESGQLNRDAARRKRIKNYYKRKNFNDMFNDPNAPRFLLNNIVE